MNEKSQAQVLNDAKAQAGLGALSGQQMNALAKQYNDALVAVKTGIELRKLALDQAIEYCGHPNNGGTDVVKIARELHAFLTEGAREQTK